MTLSSLTALFERLILTEGMAAYAVCLLSLLIAGMALRVVLAALELLSRRKR